MSLCCPQYEAFFSSGPAVNSIRGIYFISLPVNSIQAFISSAQGGHKLIILDEPTTGLDPNQLLEIRELIRELGEKKTVILSTHILQEVDAICDRVLIINKGEIIYDDQLENINKNQKQILEVSFDYRIEKEALSKIKNVGKVINTRDFDYEIYAKGTKDIRSLVFDFAHENGLKILSLQLKNQNLEQLFNNLTN